MSASSLSRRRRDPDINFEGTNPMRPIRAARPANRDAVREAIDQLRIARHLLAQSGAPRAAAAVRKTLRSAEGVARHVDHRIRRSQT